MPDNLEQQLKVQDEWMVRPSDAGWAGGAVPSVYLDEQEARDWLAWQQSDERMTELREAAEAEQAAGFPEGNPATYYYAKHRERTWSLLHRQVTSWAKVPEHGLPVSDERVMFDDCPFGNSADCDKGPGCACVQAGRIPEERFAEFGKVLADPNITTTSLDFPEDGLAE